MNILFMVGNGLDLQYDLKTRYTDFLKSHKEEYEKAKNSKNAYRNYIYDEIYRDEYPDENWSDLELEIGNLTKNIDEIAESEKAQKVFIDNFEELCNDLYEYLSGEQQKYNTENRCINFSNLIKSVMEALPGRDRSKFDNYIYGLYSQDDYISIMNFNYTNSIDRLYDNSKKDYNESLKGEQYRTYVNYPIHAHGEIDNNPILGVSDSLQVSDKFTNEFASTLIKKESIDACRENHNERNFELINSANIIVIYGMSIGETDRYIWEKVAKWSINNGAPIIIYWYKEKPIKKTSMATKRIYEHVEKEFIKMSGVKNELHDKLLDNLLIVINEAGSKQLFVDEEVKLNID